MGKKLFVLPISLVSVTVLAGFLLANSNAEAAISATANAAVTVPSSCGIYGEVDEPHTATIPNGTLESDIGYTMFEIYCNDSAGFSVYAVGYSNQEYGNTKLLANIGGTLAPTYDINTGAGTSGNSQWAMKVTPTTSGVSAQNGYGSYSVVPSTFTKVLTFASATSSSGAGAEVTYRAYISGTQPAGSYNGMVKYTVVHPANEVPAQPVSCVAGKICYNANGSNVVGTMGQQTASSNNATVTLLASNFSRTGYGFAGWSDKYDYATNPEAHFYGPNEDFTTPSTQTTTGTSLYAVWIPSAGSLQNSSDAERLCGTNGTLETAPTDSTADLSSVSALTDQRDNQTYAIAKLADGKCWMIENLRLDADYSSDSTLASGFGGVFTGLADSEPAWANESTTANSLYSTDGSTVNTISGNYQSYRFPRYNNVNTSTRASDPAPTTNSVAMYSYGNYYTWSAAMANTENLSSYSASEAANTSLCPSGWRLPTGGNKARIEADDGSEFWNLIVDGLNGGTQPANYNSSTKPYYNGSAEAGPVNKLIRSYPNNFLYSGMVSTVSAGNYGSDGVYWSSTAYSVSNAYNLQFDRASTNVRPSTNYYLRYSGYSVRCVYVSR